MNEKLLNEMLNEILIERFEEAAIEREPEIDLERATDGNFFVDFRTDCLFLGFASGYQFHCEETNFDMTILINEFNDSRAWN